MNKDAKEVREEAVWREGELGRGASKCKGPEWGARLPSLRNSRGQRGWSRAGKERAERLEQEWEQIEHLSPLHLPTPTLQRTNSYTEALTVAKPASPID